MKKSGWFYVYEVEFATGRFYYVKAVSHSQAMYFAYKKRLVEDTNNWLDFMDFCRQYRVRKIKGKKKRKKEND